MSPLKSSLIAALLAAAVTAGGLHYFQQSRVREAGWLRNQNNRMRAEASRRHVASAARPVPARAAVSPAPAGAPTTAPAAAMVTRPPVENYRNEGNATPLATLQTFAWACDRGDAELVGRLLHIDAAARPKVDAYWAALPEGVRAQWRTMDAMVAAQLTSSIMNRPFPNADVLEIATVEPITPDRVKLRLPNVPKDGTEYQQTAEGWKYVLTEAVVDAYLKQNPPRAR